MGDFPDAYTIYTANRALCWVPHHRVPGQKRDEQHYACAQPQDAFPSTAGTYLEVRLLQLRGVVPMRRGPHD